MNKSIISFDTPRIVLLIGKPKKGKSNMTKYLILDGALNQKQFNFGLVLCGTKYSNDYDFLPDDYIIQGYNEEVLNKYVDKLKSIKEETGETPASNFIIFDDLIGLLDKYDNNLMNLFSIHRHLGTSIFMCVQHLNTGTSTLLKECCSHAIMFNSKSFNTLKSLYENFGMLFENLDDFKYNFLDITKEPFTACLYEQDEDDVNLNYKICRAPDMSNVNTKLEY